MAACFVVCICHFSIPAHRPILAASSEFFEKLFTTDMREKNQHEIPLGDISGSMLRQLIEFCYSGTVPLNAANAGSLLAHAQRYCMVRLVHMCVKYLVEHLNVENCTSTWSVADALMLGDLKEMALAFICQHFIDVVQTDAFQQLAADAIIGILQSNDIVVGCEEDIFKCIMNWIRYDESNRRTCFTRLMATLRMSRIGMAVSDCERSAFAASPPMSHVR